LKVNRRFSIENSTLERLRPAFENTADRIRTAIEEGLPIWVRHHADCDGYSGAIALEFALSPLILKHQATSTKAYRHFRRLPSRTPYYSYEDASKDLSMILEDKKRFNNKAPLIIVVDNGSTEEDLLALKKLSIFGIDVIVIDHHDPGTLKDGKSLADNYIKNHINPHLAGTKEEAAELTAGMLCVELAYFLSDNPDLNLSHISAISGYADRTTGNTHKQYLSIAEKEGFSAEYLMKLSRVIDYEAYMNRYLDARQFFQMLFSSRSEEQEKICFMMDEEIGKILDDIRMTALNLTKIEHKKEFIVARIDIKGLTNKGAYPGSGTITGLIRDKIEEEKNVPVISLGITEGQISFRISDSIDLDANKIIGEIKKRNPEASVTGGGHAKAATMRFHDALKHDILNDLDSLL